MTQLKKKIYKLLKKHPKLNFFFIYVFLLQYHCTFSNKSFVTEQLLSTWYVIFFFYFIIFYFQVFSSGVFELRLKSFTNDYGKDNVGRCCSGEAPSPTGECSGPCKTRFRICLKHYQALIDTTSPCTFGDVITPVLGENSLNIEDSRHPEFHNPISFKFDFTWPVSFLF